MAEIIKAYDMRRAFMDTLMTLAEKDPRIVLIVPDVGFNYIDEFQKRFPDRYFNLGVTEQSTMCIAAGLALSGLRPFVYSMINFVAFRPFEMVRNLISQHHAPVVILGVKGSSSYRFLGFSHNMLWETEDIDLLKNYMVTYVPDGNDAVQKAVLELYESGVCGYIRL